MAVTLKDIADLVGVSVNTVSHALKDKPDISAKTRARIKNAAQALGYHPNLNARSLVLKKTAIIGLAVTESDNPVRMEFCEKMRRYLAADGYRVVTVSLQYDWPAENVAAIEELIARHVDGLVIGSVWNNQEKFVLENLLQVCQKNALPVVLFGQTDSQLADCIEIKFDQSVYLLTQHLIQQGYASISICQNSNILAYSGYRRAMLEQGLKPVAQFALGAHRMEEAFDQMNDFLNSGQVLPRAIIATNDLCAIGFIAALQQHGIRVPEDCAIAGIDNIAFGKYSNPTLTSIGFDNGECAKMVWQLLHRRIEKKETGPAIHLAVEQKLMPRHSA